MKPAPVIQRHFCEQLQPSNHAASIQMSQIGILRQWDLRMVGAHHAAPIDYCPWCGIKLEYER